MWFHPGVEEGYTSAMGNMTASVCRAAVTAAALEVPSPVCDTSLSAMFAVNPRCGLFLEEATPEVTFLSLFVDPQSEVGRGLEVVLFAVGAAAVGAVVWRMLEPNYDADGFEVEGEIVDESTLSRVLLRPAGSMVILLLNFSLIIMEVALELLLTSVFRLFFGKFLSRKDGASIEVDPAPQSLFISDGVARFMGLLESLDTNPTQSYRRSETGVREEIYQNFVSYINTLSEGDTTARCDDFCCICLGEITSEVTVELDDCGHLHHKKCFTEYVQHLTTRGYKCIKCPTCRTKISKKMMKKRDLEQKKMFLDNSSEEDLHEEDEDEDDEDEEEEEEPIDISLLEEMEQSDLEASGSSYGADTNSLGSFAFDAGMFHSANQNDFPEPTGYADDESTESDDYFVGIA